LDEAIAEHREALRLKALQLKLDYPEAHGGLGLALTDKGRFKEAISAFRKAIDLKPDCAEFHANLGLALRANGQLEDAIAAYRKAIELQNDYPDVHYNLGNALYTKRQLDEAIAEYKKEIKLDARHAKAHCNLGAALTYRRELDAAIVELKEALRLKKDYAVAHGNLGLALKLKGRLDEAIAEYREALRIQKDFAVALFQLGTTLVEKGEFREAAEVLRRGDEANSHSPKWPHAEAQSRLREAQRLARLDERLAAVLQGTGQATDAAEQLALARHCQLPCRRLHAAAARFFAEAFAQDARIAEDITGIPHRYNAACAAAVAGCGQSKDADKLDPKERTALRQQALAWLRDDLKAYRQLLEKEADRAGPAVAKRLQHWLEDGDFAGVRGAKALARLPEAERQAWQQLWAAVADTLARAEGKDLPEKKPDRK
jgi:tetratricopeptide (TPR) repeat protein